jgi:ABC-type uncharacterized transport system ATPase subunit
MSRLAKSMSALKQKSLRFMNRLAEQGLAVLFVSSELPKMFTIPDRILVLSKGKVTGEFLHDQATEEALVLAAGARQQTEHPNPAQRRQPVKGRLADANKIPGGLKIKIYLI